MMGINVNDKTQDYTGQILRGEKIVETRRTQSLRPYVGQRIGIVRGQFTTDAAWRRPFCLSPMLTAGLPRVGAS